MRATRVKSPSHPTLLMLSKSIRSLAELKIQLLQQLEKNPNSKILLKAVDECRESIRKLVRKSRLKNAKKVLQNDQGRR